MSADDTFAQQLRRLRKAAGLTQLELAERAKCSESAVRKFENGQRRPSTLIAELIAEALDIRGRDRVRFLHSARSVSPEVSGEEPVPPTNLPSLLGSLVGREKEIEELSSLLRQESVRLVTVVGPPGIGKTRLALETASRLLGEFEDGAFLVALTPVRDPKAVLPAIAYTLGLRENAHEPIALTLKDHLKNKKILLLLDNFEQVIAAAPSISEQLAQCPQVKVLVTSRELLHVRGERHFSVPPLDVPDSELTLPPDLLSRFAAVRLFIERAREADPDFLLTEENAPAVSRICSLVDGLPLGIELVAARVQLLPPRALLARLQSRRSAAGRSESLQVMSGGARDLPERHRALRDALRWSYDLLSKEEQVLFARLSVFNGGWTLTSAEAACNARNDLNMDMLDGITLLLNKSLIKKEPGQDEPRFSMLETIKEYASERLQESGTADTIKRWHAEHFNALAHVTAPHLLGPDQKMWLQQLESDHANLRSALAWLIEQGDYELAGSLAGALSRFWLVHDHLIEGRNWYEQILTKSESLTPLTRASVLHGAGMLARNQSDYEAARAFLEECLAIYRQTDDRPGLAVILKDLGTAYDYLGDLDKAAILTRESLEVYRELKDTWGMAGCTTNLGTLENIQGHKQEARALYAEALALYRSVGDKAGAARVLNNLAFTDFSEQNYESALAIWKESLVAFEEIGEKISIGIILTHLGRTASLLNDPEQAKELYERSLQIQRTMGDKHGIARSVSYLGDIFLVRGEYAEALKLMREGLVLLKETSAKLSILASLGNYAKLAVLRGDYAWAARLYSAVGAAREDASMPAGSADHAEMGRIMTTAYSYLSEQDKEIEQQAGLAMTLDEAIEYALRLE